MTTSSEFWGKGIEVRAYNILVGGYINVNVIDGSAFFLAGLMSMCTSQPHINVTLVTANPLKRLEVLSEVIHRPNAAIVDPYAETIGAVRLTGEYTSRKDYARALAAQYAVNTYQTVLIRDNETAVEFVRMVPEAAHKTVVYVTGLTSSTEGAAGAIKGQLRDLERMGVRFICQTEEMRRIATGYLQNADEIKVGILPPHVPDAEGDFDQLFSYREHPTKLAYTSKFFKDWRADKMLAIIKAARIDGHDITLEVAGDQFRADKDDPYFAANVKYLLSKTEGVTWHGRTTRRGAQEIIRRADIGIGWRAPTLDDSTELSTKILEYGALARPSIINRTPMHEQLLGSDYPLFANTIDDFRSLIYRLSEMKAEVEYAARRCYEASRSFWYTNVLKQFMTWLIGEPETQGAGTLVPLSGAMRDSFALVDLERPGNVVVDGMWVRVEIESKKGRCALSTLLAELETQYVYWKHVDAVTARILRERFIEAGERTDNLPKSPTNAQELSGVKESPLVRERAKVKKLSGEVEKLRLSEEAQRKRAESLDQKYREVERRLGALRASKLGKIQTSFWNLRNKVSRKKVKDDS